MDVRRHQEYLAEHVIGAQSLPLEFINEKLDKIDQKDAYYVHCAGGYRSMILVSLLRARGYLNLTDIKGGFKAIKDSGKFKLSPYVCPKELIKQG